jgi:tetratricopeptide (TPR) repeat protein
MIEFFRKQGVTVVMGVVIVILLCCFKNPIVAHIIREHDLVEEKSKMVTISYYFPNFDYFADIVSGAQQPKKDWMEGYYFGKPYIFHTYYQKTVDLFPDNGAAHYLLGFCEYYMGNQDVAVTQFEKSVEADPYFFWSYYNLGVIYFQQGKLRKSVEIMTKALSLSNEITLAIINRDSLFHQIWHKVANPSEVLERNVEEGQKDAVLVMTASFIKAGGYAQALKIMGTFKLSDAWHQELTHKLLQKATTHQSTTEDIDQSILDQVSVRLF